MTETEIKRALKVLDFGNTLEIKTYDDELEEAMFFEADPETETQIRDFIKNLYSQKLKEL